MFCDLAPTASSTKILSMADKVRFSFDAILLTSLRTDPVSLVLAYCLALGLGTAERYTYAEIVSSAFFDYLWRTRITL